MVAKNIQTIIEQQHNFFSQGATRCISFRTKQLTKLKKAIRDYEERILEALYADLHKPSFDAYVSEVYMTITEIDYALKNIKCWTSQTTVATPLTHKPAKSFIMHEPLGVVLIMSSWNFPLQLIMIPLVGAIAAGDCAVLKPSEHAPFTSKIIVEIIQNTFDPAYITVVEGGVSEAQKLIKQKWDYIFFTGSTAVGKIIMQAAAQHITPLTLELGGKSPCIVHNDADINIAAKHITWGKFLNAGQSCIAPDYVLVDSSVKDALINYLKKYIQKFYGTDPLKSKDYTRIVHTKNFDRIIRYLKQGTVICGGQYNRGELYIAPTILDNVDLSAPVMHEEIFGPVLPIITYEEINDALSVIHTLPKPLAVYIFSNNKKLQKRILHSTTSGGACINDVLLQATSPELPFGGVGLSGFGRYHGKYTFEIFSNTKSVFNKTSRFDFVPKYPPYTWKHRFIKKILAFFS